VGVDIDQLTQSAMEIVYSLDSYTEWSPSGRGVHVILQGEKPEGTACRFPKGVEIYDRNRYFTVTGNVLMGKTQVNYRKYELSKVIEYFESLRDVPAAPPAAPAPAPTTTAIDDSNLVQKIILSGSGPKFIELWLGRVDRYTSRSEADLAFCSILAYWGATGEQIDRLFRGTALMRDKWNRDYYRDRTIRRAISG